MSQVNVNRKNADPFYRYKMPRILAKVEGRGNGIKTVIANMTDISHSLNRPPSYATKYLGCELGAQTIIDGKNDKYVVNGSHQADKLQDVLDGFIEKYVLCPSCDNPETDIIVYPRKDKIVLKCKACGGLNPLKFVHRMNQYIFKCPPTQKTSNISTENVPTANKKSNVNEDIPVKSKKKDDVDMSEKIPLSSSTNTDWAVDTSKEAQELRIQQLEGRAKGLTANDDMEKSLNERIDMFYVFLEKIKESVSEKDYSSIFCESERLDIREYAVAVVFECFLSDGVILRGIKTYEKLIGMLIKDSIKAQRNLIGAVESLIEKHTESLLPKVSHIFKLLYDHDLVSEEVFSKWALKASTRFISDKALAERIHESARQFISWLENAEEESSEDGGDDDVTVEFSNQPKEVYQQPVVSVHQEEEEDIDIDDI